MLQLIIDNREHDLYELMKPYATENLQILFEMLDIGDIHIRTVDLSGSPTLRVVLERKAAADLGASQSDGRYREQRARLLALRGTGVKIGYIIEAPSWSPTLGRTWCLGKFNEVHLQTAIARLQLRYDIPVFHASSLKETGMWIRRFVTALEADPSVYQSGKPSTVEEAAKVYTEAIHVKKAANRTPETIFTSMLLTIPGIGAQAVKAIGQTTNFSIPTLLTKSIEDLAAIQLGKRKLGKAIATTVYTVFHEKSESV